MECWWGGGGGVGGGGGGGWVVFREILGGGVPPGFQILTLFQIKKIHFPHPFGFAYHSFFLYSFGIETTVTFIQSRSSFENHT